MILGIIKEPVFNEEAKQNNQSIRFHLLDWNTVYAMRCRFALLLILCLNYELILWATGILATPYLFRFAQHQSTDGDSSQWVGPPPAKHCV
jgi:hypothetical protein